MTPEQKQAFANEAEQALQHPLVEECIDELLGNLGLRGQALPRYGIRKVAHYAATVARAQALDIDPDALRTDAAEIAERRAMLTDAAIKAGKPVFVVAPDREQS